MYLEPTANIELGLLMFFANQDIRCVKTVELSIRNPKKQPNSLIVIPKSFEDVTIEAELVLSYCCFKATVTPDSEHWKEFVELFFREETPTISHNDENYIYENCFCYNESKGYGAVWEDSDDVVEVEVASVTLTE